MAAIDCDAALGQVFGGTIAYHTVGPDFFDAITGEWVELKTATQFARVGKKYGDFWNLRPMKYVTYTFPPVGS